MGNESTIAKGLPRTAVDRPGARPATACHVRREPPPPGATKAHRRHPRRVERQLRARRPRRGLRLQPAGERPRVGVLQPPGEHSGRRPRGAHPGCDDRARVGAVRRPTVSWPATRSGALPTMPPSTVNGFAGCPGCSTPGGGPRWRPICSAPDLPMRPFVSLLVTQPGPETTPSRYRMDHRDAATGSAPLELHAFTNCETLRLARDGSMLDGPRGRHPPCRAPVRCV